MKHGRVARQVEATTNEIFIVREQIRTLEEQLEAWTEMRDELHIRALVSETPQSAADLSAIERQCRIAVEAMTHHNSRMAELERVLDRLMLEWEPEVVL